MATLAHAAADEMYQLFFYDDVSDSSHNYFYIIKNMLCVNLKIHYFVHAFETYKFT